MHHLPLWSWANPLYEVNHWCVGCNRLQNSLVPKYAKNVEDVLQTWEDLLGLLGFELELENLVVEKIHGFMGRIVHRTITYMCSLGLNK